MNCNICGGEMKAGDNVCKYCGNVMNVPTPKTEEPSEHRRTIDIPVQNMKGMSADSVLYQHNKNADAFCSKCGRPLDGITHKCIVCDASGVSQRAYTNEDYKNREIEIMAQRKKKKKKKNTALKIFLAVLGVIVLFSAAVYGAIKLSSLLGIGYNNDQTPSEISATRSPKNTADPNWKADVGEKRTPEPTEEPTEDPVRTPVPVETGDPVKIRGGKYLYPSDTHIISEGELKEFTREEIKRIYWEIYARHGYTFDDDLADYFENNHEWYMPVTSDKTGVENKFNSIEKRNIKVIEQYQKQMGWRQ